MVVGHGWLWHAFCSFQHTPHFSSKFSLARKWWNGAYSICDHSQCSGQCCCRVLTPCSYTSIYVHTTELFQGLLQSRWHSGISLMWIYCPQTKKICSHWVGRKLEAQRGWALPKVPWRTVWVAKLEIQLTSVSHGITFLFAIYQLSKGYEYTVNMYIAC